MRGPIPSRLQDEFFGYMEAADDDDAPDGAWWQMLEDAAHEFLCLHSLHGDANDAAHQYVRMCSAINEQRKTSK